MSNESSSMSSKITIGVLVLVIIGSWIYFSSSKVDIITTYDNKIAVIDSAKAKIQAEFIEVSAKADSLTNQNTSLQGDLLDKSNQIQKLKSNISTILRKQNATDVELAEAKTLIADLNGKVTNLFADLSKAQAENKDLSAKNEVLNTTNTTLNTNLTATQKERERLQDIGSTLHASTFSIQALRIKDDGTEKITSSTKRANTIRLSFQIDRNKITPTGSQELFVCIAGPDGKAFNETGKINTREDGAKAYSNKLSVQYEQNKDLPVSYDIKNITFTEGEYLVEIYHNGFKIGEGKTKLTKGLF
jgi:peptidoglycan hydrolase CwlO-like protein